MVAHLTTAERFAPLPDALFRGGRWFMPKLTRADAAEMVRLGIIPEDASTELLNGLIVLKDRSARDQDPTMIGPGHRKCVEKLSALRSRIDSPARHVESQQPLICNESHVPEPDFMILRGTLDDYTDLPTAADAFCAVEVADSSYERDATEKLRGYAAAGVQQYVIINLRTRTAEVYANPAPAAGTYPPPQLVTAADRVALRAGAEGETIEVRLGDVLP